MDNIKTTFKFNISQRLLLVAMAVLSVFRLLLTFGLHVYFVPDTTYDDIMQITKVLSIVEGNWLGAYNSMTLVKGVGFPVITALFSFLNVPFLLAYHTLYVAACAVFLYAVHPLVKSKLVLLALYIGVLFNPIAFAIDVNRYYRDTAYYSLAFLTLSLFLCFLTRRSKLSHAFFAGFFLSLATLTREDSHFLFLYAAVVLCVSLLFVFLYKEHTIKKCAAKIVLIIFGFFAVSAPLSAVNFYFYGTQDLDEYTSSSFADAYGALSRLDGGLNDSQITIPHTERIKLYEHSPAFAELYEYLDAPGAVFEGWKQEQGEYKAGYFSFVLRDAAAFAGHFDTAQSADDYFTRLANEVNAYCDTLDYEVGSKRSGIHARFYAEDVPNMLDAFVQGIISTSKFQNISCIPIPAEADDEYLNIFENLTHSTVAANRYYENGQIVPNYPHTGFNLWMYRGMRVIIICFQFAFPALFVAAFALWVFGTVRVLAKKCTAPQVVQWLAASSFLGVYIARMVMLAFVHATTFPTVYNPAYQAAGYTALAAFVFLQLALAADCFVCKTCPNKEKK